MLGVLGKIASAVLPSVFSTIDKSVKDKDLAVKLKNDLQMALMDSNNKELKAASEIIVAEARSESFIARNWRPMTMLAFVFIIVNNYILFPYMNLFFDTGVMLDTPPDLWALIKIGLGGYVIGRSGEKVMREYKKK